MTKTSALGLQIFFLKSAAAGDEMTLDPDEQRLLTNAMSQRTPIVQPGFLGSKALIGAGLGAAGGALLPSGAGAARGAARGAMAGAGSSIGAGLGGALATAIGHGGGDGVDGALRMGGSLLGGYGGYRLGKKLTKTPKERMLEAMQSYYSAMENGNPLTDGSHSNLRLST
jgi:hypothetical protein